ncbi:MAG: diacylglycerol kinase family protein [Pseudomonadota bacterium]
MSARWLAILNPAAGRGRAARRWPRYAAALAARGINIELQTTRGPGEATGLAREAIAAGQSRILAIGGDGTLHEVLNGLIGAPTRATLALAPCGTGNDWARGRAIPRRPAAFAAMLAAGRTLAHDVGAIEYVADNGLQTRYFLNLAGVGYDAYVLEQLPRRGPRALAYLTAVAAGLIRYRPPLTQIAAAGERLSGRYFATFAALGRYAGGGMQFAPRARPDDGLLDLVTIDHLGVLATLRRLPSIYSGRLLEDPAVHWRQVAALSISTDPPARIEADGQLLGNTPATIHVLRGAIDTVVP